MISHDPRNHDDGVDLFVKTKKKRRKERQHQSFKDIYNVKYTPIHVLWKRNLTVATTTTTTTKRIKIEFTGQKKESRFLLLLAEFSQTSYNPVYTKVLYIQV